LTDFKALGLSDRLLQNIGELGFTEPTPIQRDAIPHALAGRDVIGLAQTGTGKTAAFGLPLVQQIGAAGQRPAPKTVRALILAPTRELVNQIHDHLRGYVRKTPLKIARVVGGQSINAQIQILSRGTDILVATPGRLIDLMDRRAVFIDTATFLVLDEADQMLDLGFIHALRRIAGDLGSPRQTMLFSATMPKQIADLASTYLTDPVRVEVSPPGKAADKVRQVVHFLGDRSKLDMLKDCLAERPNDLSLVFARTKHGAEKLMKMLVADGFSATSIHGNKSQGQRDRAIGAFCNGDVRILVATDVAARGIDIPGVSHVYNYDLPEVPENYVHRIGRTARAGAGGQAVAFSSSADVHLLAAIERAMRMTVPVASGERPDEDPAMTKRGRRRRGRDGQAPAHNGAPRSRQARAKGAKPGAGFKSGRPRRKARGGRRMAAAE